MSIFTALSVIALAILFIVTLILEVKSAPLSHEDDKGNETLEPLTRRQKSYQFSSKLCFYGILGIIFTIVIAALENWL